MPESMRARMGGGLLQDTVSPLGDMVHLTFNALITQTCITLLDVYKEKKIWNISIFVKIQSMLL
jgi:hypothetical protein